LTTEAGHAHNEHDQQNESVEEVFQHDRLVAVDGGDVGSAEGVQKIADRAG